LFCRITQLGQRNAEGGCPWNLDLHRASATDQIRHPGIETADLVRVDRQLLFHADRSLTSKAVGGCGLTTVRRKFRCERHALAKRDRQPKRHPVVHPAAVVKDQPGPTACGE